MTIFLEVGVLDTKKNSTKVFKRTMAFVAELKILLKIFEVEIEIKHIKLLPWPRIDSDVKTHFFQEPKFRKFPNFKNV